MGLRIVFLRLFPTLFIERSAFLFLLDPGVLEVIAYKDIPLVFNIPDSDPHGKDIVDHL